MARTGLLVFAGMFAMALLFAACGPSDGTLHRQEAQRLRKEAIATLPPDATEVTVTRDDWPTGWLTFVRVENGKPVKFLMSYTRVQATGEMTFTLTRAD